MVERSSEDSVSEGAEGSQESEEEEKAEPVAAKFLLLNRKCKSNSNLVPVEEYPIPSLRKSHFQRIDLRLVEDQNLQLQGQNIAQEIPLRRVTSQA